MRNAYRVAIFFLVILGLTACAAGAPRDIQAQALVDQSTATIGLFKSRQKDSTQLFNAALREARGIIIFPDVFEMAVGVGGQGGSGVMLGRAASGELGLSGVLPVVRRQPRHPARRPVHRSHLLADDRRRGAQGHRFTQPVRHRRAGDLRRNRRRRLAAPPTCKGADIVGFTKGSGVFLGAALSGAYVSSPQRAQPVLLPERGGDAARRSSSTTRSAIPQADGLREALVVRELTGAAGDRRRAATVGGLPGR